MTEQPEPGDDRVAWRTGLRETAREIAAEARREQAPEPRLRDGRTVQYRERALKPGDALSQ
jgi:hypothetical protein